MYRARLQDGPVGNRREVNLGNYPTEQEARAAIESYRAKRENQ